MVRSVSAATTYLLGVFQIALPDLSRRRVSPVLYVVMMLSVESEAG